MIFTPNHLLNSDPSQQGQSSIGQQVARGLNTFTVHNPDGSVTQHQTSPSAVPGARQNSFDKEQFINRYFVETGRDPPANVLLQYLGGGYG